MPIGFEVLAAGDMNPEVFAVGGFNDGLVEVCVGDEPVEPAVEDVHVGVGEVVVPVGVAGLGDEDVGCFTEGVLGGIDATDFDVELVAAVTGADDDWLTGKGS